MLFSAIDDAGGSVLSHACSRSERNGQVVHMDISLSSAYRASQLTYRLAGGQSLAGSLNQDDWLAPTCEASELSQLPPAAEAHMLDVSAALQARNSQRSKPCWQHPWTRSSSHAGQQRMAAGLAPAALLQRAS